MKNFVALIIFCFLSAFCLHAQDADRVEAGRTIGISVKGVPAEEMTIITGTYSVDKASGTINMPYLKNPVRVVGMSGRQIENILANEYKKGEIFVSPVFVVTLTTDNTVTTQFVQVGGNVAGRRSVPYRQGLTLYAAIVEAGDITDFGSRHVQVTRKGKTETYDYFSVKDRGLQLQPNDQVYVPQRGTFESRPDKLLP